MKRQTRDRINRLAEEDELPAGEFIDSLVEKEEQARLLRAMDDDFGRLREDPEGWASFQGETAAWDTTSADSGVTPAAG